MERLNGREPSGIQLGKLTLYQLSYTRSRAHPAERSPVRCTPAPGSGLFMLLAGDPLDTGE